MSDSEKLKELGMYLDMFLPLNDPGEPEYFGNIDDYAQEYSEYNLYMMRKDINAKIMKLDGLNSS